MKHIDHHAWFKEESYMQDRYNVKRLDDVSYKALNYQEDLYDNGMEKKEDGEPIKRIWDVPSYDPLWTLRSAEQYLYIPFS